MSVRTIIEVIVNDISKVPATFNGVPLVELSKIGKECLIKEYSINKALKKDFKVDGLEIKEKVTTVIR